jgi:dTDP-4-amino-4,6-dideoxygalactose transaminase
MSRTTSIVPTYQTLSPWGLLKPNRAAWERVFPFSAPFGAWTFNGRTALHAGLPALNLPKGSTILVPNYFQGVEIDTLSHDGFRLKFYRIDGQLNVNLNDAKARLDSSVAAFYAIHYFGWPQPMQSIIAFCRDHNLKLIEDCALSLFSRDKGEWLGSYGDISIFSLYKTLPLPHGGYLASQTPIGKPVLLPPPFSSTTVQLTDLIQQNMRASGWSGTERLLRRAAALVRGPKKDSSESRIASGGAIWDARLLAYGASRTALRLVKTFDPESVIAARRSNFLHLSARLAGSIETPFGHLPDGVCPLFFPVIVKDKLLVIDELAANGVGSVNLWREPHPACPQDLAAEVSYLRTHLLELPIHQSLSQADIDRVADAFLRTSYRGGK